MTAPSPPTSAHCASCTFWAALQCGDYGRCVWIGHYPLHPVTAATDACRSWQRRADEPPDASQGALPGGAA